MVTQEAPAFTDDKINKMIMDNSGKDGVREYINTAVTPNGLPPFFPFWFWISINATSGQTIVDPVINTKSPSGSHFPDRRALQTDTTVAALNHADSNLNRVAAAGSVSFHCPKDNLVFH